MVWKIDSFIGISDVKLYCTGPLVKCTVRLKAKMDKKLKLPIQTTKKVFLLVRIFQLIHDIFLFVYQIK
jgi:hypothetical protein